MTINQYAKKQTKTALAQELHVSRSSLYYKHKKPDKDEKLKNDILAVIKDNQAYGHKRVALHLNKNKKSIRRVMKLYSISPIRLKHKLFKKRDIDHAPEENIPNLIKGIKPSYENQIWCSDFTYIWHFKHYVYVATVIDIFTREILGYSISTKHDTVLIHSALEMAYLNHGTPEIFHSDQGSEFKSKKFINYLNYLKVRISMSDKGSPWQNGYQESYYSNFKLDLGHPEVFRTHGELVEHIIKTIHYYNNDRIHTSLKMPPKQFSAQIKKSHHVDNLATKNLTNTSEIEKGQSV